MRVPRSASRVRRAPWHSCRAATRCWTMRVPRWRACRRPAGSLRSGTGCRRGRSSNARSGRGRCARRNGGCIRFPRDPERCEVEARDAAEPARRNVPAHAVIGEIGERVAKGRKLPVENREDARLGRMEDQVVHPVVAVHDRRLLARRNVRRQPVDQTVHRVDTLRLRGVVLLAPAADLAFEVVAGLAVVRQARRARCRRCATARSRGSSRRRLPRARHSTRPAAIGPTRCDLQRAASGRTRGR